MCLLNYNVVKNQLFGKNNYKIVNTPINQLMKSFYDITIVFNNSSS